MSAGDDSGSTLPGLGDAALEASLTGDGALAQGRYSKAVGKGGVLVEGNVTGGIRIYQGASETGNHYRNDVIHHLRACNPNFVGRQQELDRILGIVRARRNSVQENAVSIVGMSGVGKTELAIYASHLLAKEFPDAHLIVELRGSTRSPLSTADALSMLVRQFNPEEEPNQDVGRLRIKYLDLLADKHAIIVLDDAPDDALLADLFPPAGCIGIITATRNLVTGESVPLPALPRQDSVSLLRIYRGDLTAGEAEELATLCADLPIALNAAGALLKKAATIKTAKYLEVLRSDRFREMGNVENVLSASYDCLSADLKRALRALSVLPAHFDRSAGLVTIGCSDQVLISPLDELVMLNLLTFDAESERFFFNDLLRQFALRHLHETPGEYIESGKRHAAHFALVCARIDELYFRGGENGLSALREFDRERPHIESAYRFLKEMGLADVERDQLLSRLGSAAGKISGLRFMPAQRIEWLSEWQAAASRIKDQASESDAWNLLGIANCDIGSFDVAINACNKALEISRANQYRLGEARALGNLARVSITRQDPQTETAIECCLKALKILVELDANRETGRLYGLLGAAYDNASDHRRALEYLDKQLAIARETGDQSGEGHAHNNMGRIYYHENQPQRAVEHFLEHRELARRLEDKAGLVAACRNAALAYEKLGNIHSALDMMQEGLEVIRRFDSSKMPYYLSKMQRLRALLDLQLTH